MHNARMRCRWLHIYSNCQVKGCKLLLSDIKAWMSAREWIMYLRVNQLVAFLSVLQHLKKYCNARANGFEMTWSHNSKLHGLQRASSDSVSSKKAQNVPVSYWRATCAYQRSSYQSPWLQARLDRAAWEECLFRHFCSLCWLSLHHHPNCGDLTRSI